MLPLTAGQFTATPYCRQKPGASNLIGAIIVRNLLVRADPEERRGQECEKASANGRQSARHVVLTLASRGP